MMWTFNKFLRVFRPVFNKRILTLCGVVIGTMVGSPASAAVTVDIKQVGSDVVATTTGSIDLTGLTWTCQCGASAYVWGAEGFVHLGANPSSFAYKSLTGTANPFGSGAVKYASTSTGDHFGVAESPGETVVSVPIGYVSRSPISDTATWLNETFASLGLTPGQYTFALPNDSVVVNIGASGVPEPATWTMIFVGFALLGLVVRGGHRLALAAT